MAGNANIKLIQERLLRTLGIAQWVHIVLCSLKQITAVSSICPNGQWPTIVNSQCLKQPLLNKLCTKRVSKSSFCFSLLVSSSEGP